jgi:hypothetical protein
VIVLGGITRVVLKSMTCPALMAHRGRSGLCAQAVHRPLAAQVPVSRQTRSKARIRKCAGIGTPTGLTSTG